MSKITWTIVGIAGAIVLAFSGFSGWALTPPRPMTEAYDALKSDTTVNVSFREDIVFRPAGNDAITGFIIYPGGRVDYRSYAPTAHAIAGRGYLCIILRMPFNLSVFGVDRPDSVIPFFPDIRNWAVGGHSLGGSMAAEYAAKHLDKVKGLVFWASYPASGTDLSKSGLKVITIHGTLDGLAATQKIDNSIKQLPANTTRVEIEGGNHAQFGSYGKQSGDNDAAISREQQQSQAVAATVKLLETITGR